MARTGFDGPFDNDADDPEELGEWISAGFDADEAKLWRRWRTPIALARAWREAGVSDGLTAAQWSTAAVNPSTYSQWREAGITAPEAVRWHEFNIGLDVARAQAQKGIGPEQYFMQLSPARRGLAGGSGLQPGMGRGRLPGPAVQRFLQASVSPQIMQGYLQHHWFNADAVTWARNGITADEAYMWYDLGLSSNEAARLAIKGLTPGQVAREWWGAGIPFDEVADWLGAGLSAIEAVEQRAKGITVEQAATLRALQQGEPLPERDANAPRSPPSRVGPPDRKDVAVPKDESTLEGQFQLRCRELVTEIRTFGPNLGRWVSMINEHGAVGAAQRILAEGQSRGATRWLVAQGRANLTIEHEITQPQWKSLFSDDERYEAARRLQEAERGHSNE